MPDSYIVVAPEGNEYFDTEKEALAAFKVMPSAVRVFKQGLVKVKSHHGATELVKLNGGTPRETFHLTNRGQPAEVLVER